MPEAEVSVRLAIALIESGQAASDVSVAIDGAQVKTGNTVHFPLPKFLAHLGWQPVNGSAHWQGLFAKDDFDQQIDIHSSAGQGDVVMTLFSGQVLRVESKKGPLTRSRSSQEYPLMKKAGIHILTIDRANRIRGLEHIGVRGS